MLPLLHSKQPNRTDNMREQKIETENICFDFCIDLIIIIKKNLKRLRHLRFKCANKLWIFISILNQVICNEVSFTQIATLNYLNKLSLPVRTDLAHLFFQKWMWLFGNNNNKICWFIYTKLLLVNIRWLNMDKT